ncbi:helix-turn-helix domain-containing protein [Sandaracinus amylolyticus]|uniref:helix-turn-helix domain-containing protein n=1 Tax=Sandaracinus amylolyticus TaxID=927083 RepID=UPI001F2187EC|nr:helix-turn-helix domain-containing protein [Sandaracinus amylolyticus]UJR79857.1 Hypothetical protein I5071_18960 [Sandaracinus amylolyticus]
MTEVERGWIGADGKPRAGVDVAEAARVLGRSTRHVRRLIRSKTIPAWQVTPKGPWQVDREWLLGPDAA